MDTFVQIEQMTSISAKTLQDLQFPTIVEAILAYCVTNIGQEKARGIVPYQNKKELVNALQATSEYLASFFSKNSLPNHGFEDVSTELKLLAIEGSYLEPSGFRKLIALTEKTHILLAFLNKYQEYYPTLYTISENTSKNQELITNIEAIVDKYGTVKDQASVRLSEIRREINRVRGMVNQSFNQALQQYHQLGFLDDIRETIIQNRRVLAVMAMYRRKVKGTIMGDSKTGSITYIEPEATLKYAQTLANLEYEEKEEVVKILRALTAFIQPLLPIIIEHQEFLGEVDLLAAKAHYAKSINGILPEIVTERYLFFREAYHPILFLTNKAKKEPVYPQTIEITSDKRIIVISGPNAGGKTISLKTVGLLQLMLQCGILIPVHERSKTCLFERIITDIGDNQSIENHLSTYSYRLKNMNFFLRKCNSKTLFLIDEFGTGSDPELGGALAETFLEEFYHREAFGIITTHYANLKMLANELPHATNANMLFDESTLEPLYRLVMGQAGSSFTFEVAQKNGIPFGLINRAKKKIETGKIRFDKTIASLQKERSKLEKTSQILHEEEEKAREESKRMEAINLKLRQKLESYQELYDENQRIIYLGKKINDLAAHYFQDKNKKVLIGDFLKLVEIENSKRKKSEKTNKQRQTTLTVSDKEQVLNEIQVEVAEIRKEKKERKQKKEIEKPKPILKIGDRVRMNDGKSIGVIDHIEKNMATINYGLFTTKVNTAQLALVETKKNG